MLGKFNATYKQMATTEDGDMEITFFVAKQNRWAVQDMVKDMKQRKQDGKESVVVSVSEKTKKRTLDQNALMWALLQEYADGVNAGRKSEITAERLYYQALSKYGVAEYIQTVEEAEETLARAFRFVEKVDRRHVNGKELVMFKCYLGSSKYDTKQMSVLIDGILDELAEAGIATQQVRYLEQEWKNEKYHAKQKGMLPVSANG